MTAAVADRNGYEAVEQTLLGDGAAWIWSLGGDPGRGRGGAGPLAPGRRPAAGVRGAVPDAEERAAWTRRIEACLDTGDVAGALAVLEEVAEAAAAPEVGEFAAFLRAQAPRIPDYAARRAAGLPIGSGGGEKSVDVVVNRRFKGRRGMKWGRARAEGVVALRVAELNDEWRHYLTPILHLGAPTLPAF